MCYWDENTSKQFEIPSLLTVFLLIPLNELPWYCDLVMALHKDVKSLHIGCDEVYHLGECSDCSGQGRTDVFVKHVSTVANYVKNKYPHVSLNLLNP